MSSNRVVRGTFFAAIAALCLVAKGTAHADPTITLNKWIEDIKISGDLRLRGEYFDKDTAGQVDRSRQRFRLRINTDFKLPANLLARFTFASGTGEQVSTNQSFDNLSSQKDVWIDKAYLVWAPKEWMKFQAGRMENPIWRVYSSDVVWDSDFNPEGFSESIDALVGPVRIFANALQMVADEDSGANGPSSQQADQWMIGNQIGVEFRLPFEKRLKVAGANYYWKNENLGTLSQVAVNEGNRRYTTTPSTAPNAGALINNFNVNELTGELGGFLFGKPLSIQGTYVKNRGAYSGVKTFNAFNTVNFTSKEDYGYQWGAIFGKAASRHEWEVAYFNKQVRTDATVADVSDSDFGDGGTNRKGHIFWVGYALTDFVNVSLKYFDTEVINVALAPGRDDINRTQLDLLVKF